MREGGREEDVRTSLMWNSIEQLVYYGCGVGRYRGTISRNGNH